MRSQSGVRSVGRRHLPGGAELLRLRRDAPRLGDLARRALARARRFAELALGSLAAAVGGSAAAAARAGRVVAAVRYPRRRHVSVVVAQRAVVRKASVGHQRRRTPVRVAGRRRSIVCDLHGWAATLSGSHGQLCRRRRPVA